MKKIVSIILMTVVISVSLFGCALMNGPEKAVEEVMDLVKNSELEELGEFLGTQGSDMTEEDGFLELMKLSNQTLTYEITDKTITGDKAVVTVDCTYGDVNGIITEAFKQYTDKVMALALNGEEVADEKIEEMLFDEISNAMQTIGTTEYAATIQVYCSKVEGEWVVDDSDENMPMQNVITGNLISSVEEIAKSLTVEED